jgi:ribosomal subunit interface protein
VEDKIIAIEKLMGGNNAQVWIEVGKTTRHHHTGDVFKAEVQINLHDPERKIRAESIKDDLYLAIDCVQEEIKKELRRSKEKKISLLRDGSRAFKKMITFWR